jgi:hypothetical protein
MGKVHFIEFVADPELKAREPQLNEIVRKIDPGCRWVSLKRSADGKIGYTVSFGENRTDVPYEERQREVVHAINSFLLEWCK